MQLVDRIKMIAAKQGFSLAQVEQHLGFGIRTIYKWDKNSPSIEKVLAVANFLQVPLSWLVTGKYEINTSSNSFLKQYEMLSDRDKEKIDHFMEICLSKGISTGSDSYRQLPVLGYVSETSPAEGVHFLGYTQAEADADYALIMGDSSMNPLLHQGDYIFLKKEEPLSHGDVGVFFHEHRLLCRQFLNDNKLVELRPLNARFPAGQYSKEAFTSVEITGKVILSQSQKEILAIFFDPKI